MDHDPYTAPRSAAATLPEPAGPRPISAWLLLTMLAVIAAITTLSVLGTQLAIMRTPVAPGAGLTIVVFVSWAVIVGLIVLTMVGIWRRKQWGRWLGALAILGLAIAMVTTPSKVSYASDAERAGGRFAKYIFMPLLMAGWMYRFAFSGKARRYFQ